MKRDNLNKFNITNEITDNLGIPRVYSEQIINSILSLVIEGLKRDHIVKINGFGTFKLRRKKSRIGRNPKNGKEYLISDRNVVTFYPSNKVKLFINDK